MGLDQFRMTELEYCWGDAIRTAALGGIQEDELPFNVFKSDCTFRYDEWSVKIGHRQLILRHSGVGRREVVSKQLAHLIRAESLSSAMFKGAWHGRRPIEVLNKAPEDLYIR
ncbi:hypothetical protein J6590_039970 [Homalodisca vitripennis]|nr:hypothetical protein J6590_039970 [Homalodisca vitripennis]